MGNNKKYESQSDTKRYTFSISTRLQHEIKALKDSEEMQVYVKRVIANENQERNILNLSEININEVYKILGESYTCFWGLREIDSCDSITDTIKTDYIIDLCEKTITLNVGDKDITITDIVEIKNIPKNRG